MAKKIIKRVKMQIPAGKANPAPPVGPALGQAGINISEFCQKFNADTQNMRALLFKAAGVPKGSAKPNTSKVGKITKAQVKQIAEEKMDDLNAKDLAGAMKIVEGSARAAGITVTD